MRKGFLLKVCTVMVAFKRKSLQNLTGLLETPLVSTWRKNDENQICRKYPIEASSVSSVC